MSSSFRRRLDAGRAFTLVELLVVITLVGILSLMAVSAFSRITNASGVTSAGSIVIDQLNFARQLAITKSCQVEFRIYKLPDKSGPMTGAPQAYRAIQVFTLDSAQGVANPAAKAVFLPGKVEFVAQSDVSTLLAAMSPPFDVSGAASGQNFLGFGPASYSYICFEFNPDGSTDLDPAKKWFASLASKSDPITSGSLPPNFFTVQVDPATGRVRVFRPN